MTATRSPQIVLTLTESGLVRAEAPGKNGMREKLGEFGLSELPLDLRASLIAQQEALRVEAQAKLLEAQRNNFSYVAATQGVGLAERIWKQTLKLHKGNLVPAEKKIREPKAIAPVGDLSELESL